MIVYLAGVSKEVRKLKDYKFNCLETYFDYDNRNADTSHIKRYENFVLDSGAFSFFNPDRKVDWNAYVERYCTFINDNDIDLFFEFDIDIIVGLPQVEIYRKKIETLTNKKPIPVWRPSRGYEYWKKMVRDYPYIAISASGKYDSAWCRLSGAEKILKQMVQYAHKHNTKVHGLGYTKLKYLNDIQWDSVDSTTWLNAGKFGELQVFNGTTIVKQQAGKIGMQTIKHKQKEMQLHNFNEWIKYGRYAKANL